MNLSKLVVYGVMAIFFLLLIGATVIAYSRGFSGTTGLDMAKVQKLRTEAFRENALR
jgi:hypothetical protein